jgi:hypothetical protein
LLEEIKRLQERQSKVKACGEVLPEMVILDSGAKAPTSNGNHNLGKKSSSHLYTAHFGIVGEY